MRPMESSIPKAAKSNGTTQEMQPMEIERRSESAAPTRFVPDNIEDVQRMARMFYFGGLMKKHFYKDASPEGVRNAIAGIATMIIYGAELGLSPTQAFRTMHVIEGAPSLSAAGKVALVKRSPKCHSFEVIEESDDHCMCETIRLRHDGTKMPPRRLTVRIWWKDAKDIPAPTAGLLYVLPTYDNKGNLAPAWARYPGRLAKARCSSWLCDNVYEDVTMGLYSTEEIIDFSDRRTPDRVVEDIFSMIDDSPARPGRTEASDDEPAQTPVVAAEPPKEAPSKPGPTKADYDALLAYLPTVGESVMAEELQALRARVDAFSGMEIGYRKLIAAWEQNEALGKWQVVS